MKLIVQNTAALAGEVLVPPSKSHTHRAIIIASLSEGTSRISNPLRSGDITSTIEACKAFGARFQRTGTILKVTGVAGRPAVPLRVIDVGNSGTTIRLMGSLAALCDGSTTLTGDESIQGRPMGPLLTCLNDLGAQARSIRDDENPPVEIIGPMQGGSTTLQGLSSQFLSSLLIASPLAAGSTRISVVNLRSSPYAAMTLTHLERAGAVIDSNGGDEFKIGGGQLYTAQDFTVPGDFSSAAFLLAANHVTDSRVEVLGLDDENQADRFILEIMRRMQSDESRVFDLGECPDLLPITAVLGCYSQGRTTLRNVEHARLKECDRITAICSELAKMGARIEERPDGLTVERSSLRGAVLDGHKDHRIVMALAVAALRASGRTEISDSEVISISFPDFIGVMRGIGADMTEVAT